MIRRILLVDDHPIVRAGVAQLIRDRWHDAEVAEAGTLAEALGRLEEGGWNAVVLDLSLPDAQGLEGLARLRRKAPDTRVLVLSMHAEAAYAARALQGGAAGYLTKDRAGTELMTALDRVLSGGRYVTASLAETLAGLLTGQAVDRPAHEALSAQEHRVLLLLAGEERGGGGPGHAPFSEDREHLSQSHPGQAASQEQRGTHPLLPGPGADQPLTGSCRTNPYIPSRYGPTATAGSRC